MLVSVSLERIQCIVGFRQSFFPQSCFMLLSTNNSYQLSLIHNHHLQTTATMKRFKWPRYYPQIRLSGLRRVKPNATVKRIFKKLNQRIRAGVRKPRIRITTKSSLRRKYVTNLIQLNTHSTAGSRISAIDFGEESCRFFKACMTLGVIVNRVLIYFSEHCKCEHTSPPIAFRVTK